MIEVGYTVNYITVIDNNFIKEGRKKLYLCSCKCGSTTYVNYETLRTKRIRDCGCGTYMLEKHIGEKYNHFTVVNCIRKRMSGKINIVAICKCSCGNYREIPVSLLKNRYSCGCVRCYKPNKEKNKSKTKQKNIPCRLKRIYSKMKDRCYNNKAKDYKWYGLKGITICDEWLQDINNFKKWALENGYNESLTIDRIDSSKNYCPENCRWATMREQQNNRSNNVKYEYKNLKLTLAEISRLENFNYNTLCSRIRNGMSLDEALSKPIKRR